MDAPPRRKGSHYMARLYLSFSTVLPSPSEATAAFFVISQVQSLGVEAALTLLDINPILVAHEAAVHNTTSTASIRKN